jgi:hypothetical protein
LKWLQIHYFPFCISKESGALTDAVFLELFSLMQLEHFYFDIWRNKPVLLKFILRKYFSLFNNHNYICLSNQLTDKAYLALLEGPFADSILETSFFGNGQYRLRESAAAEGGGGMVNPVVENSLEILGKLEDRLAENRRKFPWKTLHSSIKNWN